MVAMWWASCRAHGACLHRGSLCPASFLRKPSTDSLGLMRDPADIECWLTDMDGVLVHENHEVPGASDLINRWVDTSKRFLVLTNNSIFTPRDLAARMQASGLTVPEDNIWTSALATAHFLADQHPASTSLVRQG